MPAELILPDVLHALPLWLVPFVVLIGRRGDPPFGLLVYHKALY